MKTTLLDRENNSEKAFTLLNKHKTYSSIFSSSENIQEKLIPIKLDNIDLSLLLNAFTHRSFANENTDWPFDNYERLEFVGDSVLELIITENIYFKYRELPEGELSKFRSAVVNENFLADWNKVLGLNHFILLGKGELKNTDFIQESILADIFEAILGAVFISQGLEYAKETVHHWIDLWESKNKTSFFDLKRLEEFDPKSRLQELTLALNGELPNYNSITNEDGSFEVTLSVEGKKLGVMTSNSKRKAEKALAIKALRENLINNQNRKEV